MDNYNEVQMIKQVDEWLENIAVKEWIDESYPVNMCGKLIENSKSRNALVITWLTILVVLIPLFLYIHIYALFFIINSIYLTSF